jgi:putative ABC transport system permease protein
LRRSTASPESVMPDWKSLVRSRIGTLPLDATRESDVVDELAQHVAQHHAELTASGVDEADAVRQALAPFDDPRRVAAEIARADRRRPAPALPAPPDNGSFLVDFGNDLRYAARLLWRAPGFSVVALLTIALGIGANTSIFSVMNAVLLRPLPYVDPGRLVLIGERGSDGMPNNVGYSTFVDWRERTRGFEELTLIRSWNPTLLVDGQAERVSGMRVAANFFHTLGARPAIGRDFTAEDDTPAGWQVVILADATWRRTFGADPAIVGRVISLSGLPFAIIGVMPPTFEPLISERFYARAGMWAPVGYDASHIYACRSCQHLKAIGRLQAGTTLEAARANADSVQTQLRREHPADYAPSTMTLVPAGIDRAHGRRWIRPPDRLRQRRQPAAGPSRAPRTGSCAADGARRQPSEDCQAADGRKLCRILAGMRSRLRPRSVRRRGDPDRCRR